MNISKENLLGISWHDSAWIPILNPGNVLDYFSERSNIFYDRTCNNELVKMQRLGFDQLTNMTGLEYILLHVQEPVLYVIRKQHRHSPSHATPLADYYIIAGRVYQAPDLGAVVNSRLLNTVNHLQSAFEECMSYTRYHPSKGYWWDFKDSSSSSSPTSTATTDDNSKKKDKQENESSSAFQRQRVDMLLGELAKKFPLPLRPLQHPMNQLSASAIQLQQQSSTSDKQQQPGLGSGPNSSNGDDINTMFKSESKENDTSNNKQGGGGPGGSELNQGGASLQTQQQSKLKPPPEKKPRLN